MWANIFRSAIITFFYEFIDYCEILVTLISTGKSTYKMSTDVSVHLQKSHKVSL